MNISRKQIDKAIKEEVKEQLKEKQKKEEDKILEKSLKEMYADYCPYCNKTTILNGKKDRIVMINGIKYISGKCSECNNTIYCHLEIMDENVIPQFLKLEDIYNVKVVRS
jgi:thiol-disulfide isomerase/thioredoxin